MSITIILLSLFVLIVIVKWIWQASKVDYVIDWDNAPKIEGGLKLSHTIYPENQPTEEEWKRQYTKRYVQSFFDAYN